MIPCLLSWEFTYAAHHGCSSGLTKPPAPLCMISFFIWEASLPRSASNSALRPAAAAGAGGLPPPPLVSGLSPPPAVVPPAILKCLSIFSMKFSADWFMSTLPILPDPTEDVKLRLEIPNPFDAARIFCLTLSPVLPVIDWPSIPAEIPRIIAACACIGRSPLPSDSMSLPALLLSGITLSPGFNMVLMGLSTMPPRLSGTDPGTIPPSE